MGLLKDINVRLNCQAAKTAKPISRRALHSVQPLVKGLRTGQG